MLNNYNHSIEMVVIQSNVAIIGKHILNLRNSAQFGQYLSLVTDYI